MVCNPKRPLSTDGGNEKSRLEPAFFLEEQETIPSSLQQPERQARQQPGQQRRQPEPGQQRQQPERQERQQPEPEQQALQRPEPEPELLLSSSKRPGRERPELQRGASFSFEIPIG